MDYISRTEKQNIWDQLTEKRRIHTEGVLECALAMAERFGADADKAEVAVICHDVYRGRDDETLNALIDEFGIEERYKNNANLSHSKLAAAMMERDLGIEDREILDAVSFHTTGRKGMTTLEKIVFLADAIEKGRDYPGVDDIRKQAETDLDAACLMSLEGTIGFLKEQGLGEDEIDKDTIEARDDLLDKSLRKERGSKKMDTRELALTAAKALDDKQGTDIVIIDIGEKSSFADYLVLASGSNERLIAALTDEVEDKMAEEGVLVRSIEGTKESGWILMDYGDMIVNILTTEMRERYNIEKVWADCEKIIPEE